MKYGLNVKKNFLCMPDGLEYIEMDKTWQVRDWCAEILFQTNCAHAAICVVPLHEPPYMVFTYCNAAGQLAADYVNYKVNTEKITGLFQQVDGTMDFAMLGLIVEVKDDKWRIIEE